MAAACPFIIDCRPSPLNTGLVDEQAAAGDPSRGIGQPKPVSDFMPGWAKWFYPNGGDPSANGGVQALIDLKAVHAISDIWLNHGSGYVQARLDLFLNSPFDNETVHSILVNTTQVNGKVAAPPPVCAGWGWAQRWCGWNTSRTEQNAPKARFVVVRNSPS